MKKNTWIIICLALFLGLVYYFTKPEKISVGVKKLSLPAFDSSSITRIEISGKNPVSLVKADNNQWMLELGSGDSVRHVHAENAAVESMLQAASSLSPSYYVSELEEKQAELGLDKDNATTIKLYAKEPLVWSLVVGKTDGKSGRYAKLLDDNHIYALRGDFWHIIKPKISEWRETRIFNQAGAELSELSFESDNKKQVVLKKAPESKAWELDKAELGLSDLFRADHIAVASLARAALELRATDFIDEALKKDLPGFLKRIVLKTSDNKEISLIIMPRTQDKYLLKASTSDQLFEVNKNTIDRLFKPLSDLRELSLMKFDASVINKITIKNPKSSIVLEKNENAWKISEPAKLPKDFEFEASSAAYVLSVLEALKAERILDKNKDKAQDPNWQKKPVIELSDKEGNNTYFYVTKSKNKADEYLVKGNIDEEVYIIPRSKLLVLERGLDAFKKQEIDLPAMDERTKGFESLPVDVQRKLLDAAKKKHAK